MKIFIPRLSSATTSRELKRLIDGLLKQRFHFPFTRWPVVSSCEVLQFRDGEGAVEYHGLVSIHPDEAGSWLIDHFREQRLHGRCLTARKFMERRAGPRAKGVHKERRRFHLQVSRVSSSSPTQRGIDQQLGHEDA